MDADVVIVGAGPAGCAAAYDLAGSGRRVIVLERSLEGRTAVCGGGVTARALKALRFAVDPVVDRVCRSMTVTCRLAANSGTTPPNFL